MKVALCQLDIAWENKESNHRRVQEMLDSGDVEPGTLLVLPEMFSTGFSMDVAKIREGEGGLATRFMSELAESRGIYVVGGIADVGEDGRGVNQAVAFDPQGRESARYSKIHPFIGGEAKYYTGGHEIALFDSGGLKVCPLVCYDLRFPELFRAAVEEGAELFAVIANWPVARIGHWVTLLQARAIENQTFVLGVNRVGSDPYLEYSGSSMIVDPKGVVIAKAGSDETMLTADLDPDSLRAWRREFPVLRDIRFSMSLKQTGN